jgi:16S rRNA (uracil1498-N3)-methyltransferase
LGAEETRHLRDVLRLRAGDEAYVFDGAGREFSCHVGRVDRASATMEIIQEVEPASPESPLRLTLAIALLKGEKFDLVVQKATELGVSRLIPLITSRADVKIKGNEDAGRKVTRWQRIALEATKQCGRAKLMNVNAPVPFGELVQSSSSQDELRLMFAERNGGSLDTVCRSAAQFQLVTAVVGSEGGWTDQEIDQARAAGWQIRYEPKAVVRHIHSATSVEWSPTFVFHSTRNRLLMLTKDASAARVRREWMSFLRETVNLLRFVVGALRRGRKPSLQRLRMQARVLRSLVRLTPSALRARRQIARSAKVSRSELESWLVTAP